MPIVDPTEAAIEEASRHLRAGRLIGMPTETVYGVAADTFNEAALRATFELKGRPAENPLIVHVGSYADVGRLAREWPDSASRLAERFWPGPLTLVVRKQGEVPDLATGGLGTVAIRMPAHPVARALISSFGSPLTAPSANPFQGLSPTTALAIDPSIASGLMMILDGGPCEIGIESCVVDLSEGTPVVLRPGSINVAEIEEVVGQHVEVRGTGERRSPGLYDRHYAPQTRVELVSSIPHGAAGIELSADALTYARELYEGLRRLDREGHDTIYVVLPPDKPEWTAVRDRLFKAAGSVNRPDR